MKDIERDTCYKIRNSKHKLIHILEEVQSFSYRHSYVIMTKLDIIEDEDPMGCVVILTPNSSIFLREYNNEIHIEWVNYEYNGSHIIKGVLDYIM